MLRVSRVQTRERGPPSALAEIFSNLSPGSSPLSDLTSDFSQSGATSLNTAPAVAFTYAAAWVTFLACSSLFLAFCSLVPDIVELRLSLVSTLLLM